MQALQTRLCKKIPALQSSACTTEMFQLVDITNITNTWKKITTVDASQKHRLLCWPQTYLCALVSVTMVISLLPQTENTTSRNAYFSRSDTPEVGFW